MKFYALLLFALLQFNSALWADGEGDNNPEQVRQVPRVGVQVSDEDRTKLKAGLEELAELMKELES